MKDQKCSWPVPGLRLIPAARFFQRSSLSSRRNSYRRGARVLIEIVVSEIELEWKAARGRELGERRRARLHGTLSHAPSLEQYSLSYSYVFLLSIPISSIHHIPKTLYNCIAIIINNFRNEFLFIIHSFILSETAMS